jgi:protein-disulfide isomerase
MADTNPNRPRRKKKKKKRKKRAASAATASEPVARPRRKRRRREPEPPPEQQWTSGHMLGALILGLAVGGIGGYYASGDSEGGGTASKDAVAANGQPGAAQQNPKKPNARQAPAQPGKPVYIALEKHSPRLGPEHAKVTILEYSDFQ